MKETFISSKIPMNQSFNPKGVCVYIYIYDFFFWIQFLHFFLHNFFVENQTLTSPVLRSGPSTKPKALFGYKDNNGVGIYCRNFESQTRKSKMASDRKWRWHIVSDTESKTYFIHTELQICGGLFIGEIKCSITIS
jgi:hypothetical protein